MSRALGYLMRVESVHIARRTPQTWYFASFAYTSAPTDSPPSEPFDLRIVQPFDAVRSVFKGGQTSGQSQTQTGDITLQNTDRALDVLREYTFGGRPMAVWCGDPATLSLAYLPNATGVAQHPDIDTVVTFRFVDAKAPFDAFIQSRKYLGTGGVEGTVQLQGKPKVLLIGGWSQEIPAPCLDPIKELYDINDGPIAFVSNAKNAGASLTYSGDYSSEADWLNDALAPAYGCYMTWLDGGKVRINTAGAATDVTFTAAEYLRTTALACKRVALLVGIDDSGLVLDDFTLLDIQSPGYVERWIGPEEIAAKVIFDEFATGAGCGWGARMRDGKIRLVRVQDRPEGPVSQTITVYDNPRGKPVRQESADDKQRGKPAKRVTLTWGHNYAVRNGTQLADSVSALDRTFFAQADRSVTAYDAATDALFLDALELNIPTRFWLQVHAQQEADRLLAFRKSLRFGFQVPVFFTAESSGRDLFDVVGLDYNSSGLQVNGLTEGIPMWVLSVAPNAAAREIELGLWGSSLDIRNLVTQDGAFLMTQDGMYLITQGT